MDAMDILGGLLGKKSGSGGMGGQILKEILGGGSKSAPQTRSAPPSRTTQSTNPSDIASQASSLEDLLNVAVGRSANRKPVPQPAPVPQQQPPSYRQAPRNEESGNFNYPAPSNNPFDAPAPVNNQNDQAIVLVKAMINAAKADGQISQQEQQEILSHMSDNSPSTIQFLREEFSKPMNVRDFAWSVPMGMEQQVYMISLVAIELDSNKEAGYLKELAHGLRIPPQVCNELHQRAGAQPIF